jgi:hypothetical protein
MEQPSNTNQSLNHVVSELIHGKSFNSAKNDLSFEDFREIVLEESNHSVSWKKTDLGDKDLYLFSTDWQIENKLPTSNDVGQDFINKYFNSLVIEVKKSDSSDPNSSDPNSSDPNSSKVVNSEYRVLMYGGPKVYDSNRDKTSLDKVKEFIADSIAAIVSTTDTDIITDTVTDANTDTLKVYDAFEGTSINAFYCGGEWRFCTKRKLDMFESKFGNQRTHGEMVEEIVGDFGKFKETLDKDFTYHFVLVHSNNSHLSHIEENKLVLTTVRKVGEFHKTNSSEYDRMTAVDTGFFHTPTKSSIQTFELGSDSDPNEVRSVSTQGIIIQYNDFVFRVYNKSYAESLKRNPHFYSKHEKCFFDYQNNAFSKKDSTDEDTSTDSDEKTWTIAAFNFVAICLFRTLTHFTKFANNFSPEELKTGHKFIKLKEEDWKDYITGAAHGSYNNALIRNINKLQRIPFAVKNIQCVDFNQVKHHLKYYCKPQDIYAMYNTFVKDIDNTGNDQYNGPGKQGPASSVSVQDTEESTLCEKIGYKSLPNVIDNILAFRGQQKVTRKPQNTRKFHQNQNQNQYGQNQHQSRQNQQNQRPLNV